MKDDDCCYKNCSSSSQIQISPDHLNGKDKKPIVAFPFHHYHTGGSSSSCSSCSSSRILQVQVPSLLQHMMSMNRIILLGGLSLLVVWLVLEQHYYQNSARVNVNVYLMKNDSLAAAAAAAAAAATEQQRSLTNQPQNQQQHQQQQQTEQKEPKKQQRHRPIRQISILGERNSGTRWTYE
jgi:hypothetical protein